jgi:hypothetical protein
MISLVVSFVCMCASGFCIWVLQHVICTNRGPSFTKGDEDPSEVKAALVDRSNFHQVRKEGTRTHDDAEFERNIARDEVATKMRAFRILTCLTGMLRMLIFRQTYLQPDLSFAQRLFDEWDKELDEKYGLPRLSPRKNIKRQQNLITMCCLNAVAHVFFYKQTSCTTDAGKVDKEFPNGRPFEIGMLYECVQLLQPTREMIHRSWSMGLEYNVGTSSMGTTAMTVVAETVGMEVGSFFRIPKNDYSPYVQSRSEMNTLVDADRINAQRRKEALKEGKQVPPPAEAVWQPPDTDRCDLENFEGYFNGTGSVVSEEDIAKSRTHDRMRREARIAFQLRCSKNASISRKMNVGSLVDQSMLDKALTLPLTTASEDSAAAKTRGALLHEQNVNLHDIARESNEVREAYHEARSVCHPGKKNCPFKCKTLMAQQQCFYCMTDLEQHTDDASGKMSLNASLIWPTLLDGALFYKTQTLVQMAADSIVQLQAGAGTLGTKRFGSTFSYKKKTTGNTGASRVDIGWVHAEGEQWTSWNRVADHVSKKGNPTVSRFDIHKECLRDTMYMLSTSDNARRCPEEPRLADYLKAENALQGVKGNKEEGLKLLQVTPYFVNSDRNDTISCKTHLAGKRSPSSGISTGSFQRRFDSMMQGGRLCALNFMVSPRVSTVAPLRMHHDGLEINIGGLYNHVSLVAELIKSLASVPGLKNMQEKFSNSRQGPEGLSADRSTTTMQTATVRPILSDDMETGMETEMEAEDAADASSAAADSSTDPVAKRGREVEAPQGHLHTLPYSYDVVPMGIALDMLRKLYDDKGGEVVEGWKSTFETFGSTITFEALPQISTSFVGYGEFNRQTLSVKLGPGRPCHQEKVDAGDPDMAKMHVSHSHVSRSIGRKASNMDIELWVSRRQGARSTGQLEGDLFAYSTWVEHTFQSALQRGFVCTRDDNVFQSYMDMEHMVLSRALELASDQGDVEFGLKYNVDFAHVKLEKAEPMTYEAVTKSGEWSVPLHHKKVARLNKPNINYGGGAAGAVRRKPRTTNRFSNLDDESEEEGAELGESSAGHMDVDDDGPFGGTLTLGPRPA